MARQPAASLEGIELLPVKGRAAQPEPLPADDPAQPAPPVQRAPRRAAEPAPLPEPKAPEQRVAMTYRPRIDTHRGLKVIAAQRGITMQDILDHVMDAWVDANRGG